MKAKTKKYKYMHTVDEKPAFYNGEQLCFAEKRWPVIPVNSIETIKSQQERSKEWRLSRGHPLFFKYDYLRVLTST